MCGDDTKYLSFNHHIPRPSTAIHSHLTAGESDHGRNQRIPRPQNTSSVYHLERIDGEPLPCCWFYHVPLLKPTFLGVANRHRSFHQKSVGIIRPSGQLVGFLGFQPFGWKPQLFWSKPSFRQCNLHQPPPTSLALNAVTGKEVVLPSLKPTFVAQMASQKERIVFPNHQFWGAFREGTYLETASSTLPMCGDMTHVM